MKRRLPEETLPVLLFTGLALASIVGLTLGLTAAIAVTIFRWLT